MEPDRQGLISTPLESTAVRLSTLKTEGGPRKLKDQEQPEALEH